MINTARSSPFGTSAAKIYIAFTAKRFYLAPSSTFTSADYCITDANSRNPMLRLFSGRAQKNSLPMAGRLDPRDHFDSDEDLGISRGHSIFLDPSMN